MTGLIPASQLACGICHGRSRDRRTPHPDAGCRLPVGGFANKIELVVLTQLLPLSVGWLGGVVWSIAMTFSVSKHVAPYAWVVAL